MEDKLEEILEKTRTLQNLRLEETSRPEWKKYGEYPMQGCLTRFGDEDVYGTIRYALAIVDCERFLENFFILGTYSYTNSKS